MMNYDLLGRREECYRPVHWPGKWAAISLIISGEKRTGGKKSGTELKGERTPKQKKKEPASEKGGGVRVTKRAASWCPGGGCNQPGQHFTCVTSCWPQQEERGMAWWPAGHGACQADTGGYASRKAGTHASTHIRHFSNANKCDSG